MSKSQELVDAFTRHKTLRQQFDRLRIDENDLARLAFIMKSLQSRFGGKIEISIVSADGEETIRTNDPDFFVSSHMPPQIRSVSISYRNYSAPVSCSIDLSPSSLLGR